MAQTFKFYQVWGPYMDPSYHATMAEARKELRRQIVAWKENGDGSVPETEIQVIRSVPITKANFIQILNERGGSFCESFEIIETHEAQS